MKLLRIKVFYLFISLCWGLPLLASPDSVGHLRTAVDRQITRPALCFSIQQVILIGEHQDLFQFALKKALANTQFYAGKCLSADDMNQIMRIAQNAIIGRGYTTTRILAASQDLKKGTLTLTVFPGYLKNIEIDLSHVEQTYAKRIATFQNEFPKRSELTPKS